MNARWISFLEFYAWSMLMLAVGHSRLADAVIRWVMEPLRQYEQMYGYKIWKRRRHR